MKTGEAREHRFVRKPIRSDMSEVALPKNSRRDSVALPQFALRPSGLLCFVLCLGWMSGCGVGSDDGTPGAESGGAVGSGGGPMATGGNSNAGGALIGSGGTNSGGSATGGSPDPSGGATFETGGAPGSGGNSSSGGALTNVGGAGGTGQGSGGASSGGETGTGGGPPEFSPCPETGPCVLLPLGDSITEGFASSGGGYRVELFKQALAANQDITFVGDLQNGPTMVSGTTFPRRHEGHGGFTIDSDQSHSGISGEITSSALSDHHPHIVLLMIGTNDINGNVSVQNAPNRLGNLIDSITSQAPDALVVVASIIPVLNSGTNAKVLTYNTAVEQVVSDRATGGDHVVFLDNYEAIASQPNYSSALMADGLHPNDAGYAVLGRAFYGAIEPLLR